jgi:hypothetical protein
MRIQLLLLVWLLTCGLGFGQVTIFNESIGTCCGGTNTAIASTIFDNSSLTFSGTADTRTSTASTGYTGASAGRNVFLTNNGTSNFQIASINTTAYTNLVLSFGAQKTTTASNLTELLVEYSVDGVNYLPLTFPAQPTGSGTTNWRLLSGISLPSAAEGISNLRLRWTNTSTTPQFRIDDILLIGTFTAGCNITNANLSNIACNDNGTNTDASDDFITFDLDPSGSDLGTSYNVSVSSGTINPTTASYGSTTAFTLQNGSAGNGDVTVTLTDATDNTCTLNVLVTDPGSCNSGGSCGGNESFNNSNALSNGSYGAGNFVGDDGINWIYSEARDQDTYPINGEGIMLRRASDSYLEATITGGVGSLSFDYRKAFTGAAERQLELLVNGTQVATTTIFGNSSGADATVYNLSYPINSPTDVTIRIKNVGSTTTNRQTVIDNIIWTCYVPGPEIQLVDADSNNQNCGYTIDFGNQPLASNTDVSFVIQNIGSLDLDINSLNFTGDFTLVTPPAIPFTIAPSGSQTITVRFTPSANGTRTGTLTINNNDADESSCTVQLTGEGFTPEPNIRVRANTATTPTISGNGDGTNTPNGLQNTLFAAQTIGNSQDKDYIVINEGTAPLNISNITITGANPGDFLVTQAPISPLAAGTDDILEITFSPSAAGVRTAIVTIISNDPDTPNYVFNIHGTGICSVSSPTLSPSSGPTGTIVTLNGDNFGASTSLAYQGSPIGVTIISTTQLEFEIPVGAGSGTATFINDIGCQGAASFNVLNNTITSCEGSSGTAPSDLFISEITDATYGGLTYIEIYNGTGATVALGDYAIQLFRNGSSSAIYTLDLNAVDLFNNNTYVVAVGFSAFVCSVSGGDGNLANQIATQEGINKVDNEHDMLRLVKNSASIIVDEFGEFENENWMDATIITGNRGFNFRRLNTSGSLPRVPFNLADWEVIDWAGSGSATCQTNNDYSNIGFYDFSLGTPPTVSTPVLNSTNCLDATISVTATEGFVGGNALNYQWYSVAPGDTNWAELTDNSIYSGTNTNTLTINNTFNLNNYQYYCEVRENTVTCSQASDAVRIEIEQTTWNGFTWSNGVPNSDMVAVLNANYTTAAPTPSFSACNLIVNAELNITDNYYVEVFNDAIVNAGGNVIVQTRGAFVQRNDNGLFNLNGGNASVNKDTATKQNWYDYTYWSSPVVNETAENAFGLTPANRRFYFEAQNFVDIDGNDIDDIGNDWQLASGLLTPGVGYAATSFNIGPFPRIDQNNFIGAFNNGIIDVPVYRNAANPITSNNWNFIGNPYPSAIDFVEFFNQNNTVIEGAAYLWSQAQPPLAGNPGNEGLNFNQSDYAIISGSGNVAGGAIGLPPNNFIPSSQGFFVNATGNGTVTFSNSIRMADTNSNSTFYRSNNVVVENKLWLNLTSDNGVFNQMLVAYVDGATNEDDGMYYDAPRNLSTGTFASLYSTINNSNKPFAIQGKDPTSLRPDEVIALGFTNSISLPTVFTISIAQMQGDFMNNNIIYLKDNLLNLTHDLTQSDYNFTAEVGQFNQRFEIVFNRETLSVGDENLTADGLAIIELPNGDVQFIVSQQHQIKEVTIVDLMGRVVYQLKGNHHTETYNLSQLSKAAYIAKVTLANGQTLHKKAVKRF